MHCRFSTRRSGLFVVLICCAPACVLSSINAAAFVSDEMTSDEAATLLKSHEMFATPQTVTLNTGTIHSRLSDLERYPG